MLVIRLTRVGKKNSPAYRVVVADKRKAVKRKFIEILGNYNPAANPKTLVIDKEKALHWIGLGAQPSDTVNNLMCQLEILPKNKMIKKVYSKPTKKKNAGKVPAKAGTEEKKTETEETEAETTETTPEETAETSEENVSDKSQTPQTPESPQESELENETG